MRHILVLLIAGCICSCLGAPASARETMLVVGDSLSIPLGEQLERYYSLRPDVQLHRQGKVSSGLARPDFYDWETQLDRLSRRYRPDVLVIMLGTNDFKSLDNGVENVRFATQAWNREYARRVQRLVDIARRHSPHVAIHWMGAPIMGRDDLNAAVRHINQVVKLQLERNSACFFIDSGATLADANGRYVQYAPSHEGRVRLRADDGVHVTSTGAALLADRCLESLVSSGAAPAMRPTLAQQAVSFTPAVQQAASEQMRTKESRVPPRAATHASRAYAIQESSWANAAQAEHRAEQLSARGVEAWVKAVHLGAKGVWHRVMIGSYASLAIAKEHKQMLSKRISLAHALIIKLG